MHLFNYLCNNSRNTFLQVIIFTNQPTLNVLYCSTILLKCPRISTGIPKWQLHGLMACDFLYKKDKKCLFLLHIEVDSHNPADNTVQYMTSVPLLVPFLCGSLKYLVTTNAWKKKKKSNQPKILYFCHVSLIMHYRGLYSSKSEQ